MPKVSINIIKDWFRNQQKPPQEQFWAWLDSFWHRDDKIPQNAVDGLPTALQKKADLVDGLVPLYQLPFTVNTSEVIAIGAVTSTSETVTVAVHSSGKNQVRINGKIYERSFPNTFNFIPVSQYYKILVLYATPDAGLFFLAEGAEALEAVEPEVPQGALIIRRIVVTTDQQELNDVEQEIGYKPTEEDMWREVEINTVTPTTINLGNWLGNTFILSVLPEITTPQVGGIYGKVSKFWPGRTFLLKNDSNKDILLTAGTHPAPPLFCFYPFSEDYILKAGTWAFLKLNDSHVEVVKLSAPSSSEGGANLPEGNSGDVLVKGAEGWQASNRLTEAEAAIASTQTTVSGIEDQITDITQEIDAEVVNRATADQQLQQNINNEATARAEADALKVDKPTTDGTFSLKKLGNVFTWIAVQAGLDSSGLVDKMGTYWDATAGKLVSNGLKFVAGTINQLEFSGRIKADALVLPNNTNPVVPNRLRSTGSRLKYSDNSSVERDVAFLSDFEGTRLLTSYIHTGNKETYPTAVDYSTGLVTCVNHGYTHSGQLLIGLFSTFIDTNGVVNNHTQTVIPLEWLNANTYIKVIDENTLMICDVGGGIINVNPNSVQNNGKLDFSKWHIESFVDFTTPECPSGITKFRISIKGACISGSRYNISNRVFWVNLYTESSLTTSQYTSGGAGLQGNSNKNNIVFALEINIDISDPIFQFRRVYESSFQCSGGFPNYIHTAMVNSFFSKPPLNNGIHSLNSMSGGGGTSNNLANGTKIEIYIQ